MDRKTIRLTAEDINLTEVETSVLMQTTGDVDIIFDDGVVDILFEKYFTLLGWSEWTEDDIDDAVGDDAEKQIW